MSAEASRRANGRPPDAPSGWQVVALRTSVQILLAVAALVAVLWVLHRVEGVLMILAMSVLFAYLVAPVVTFFRRPLTVRGAKRALPVPVAVLTAYTVIFGTIAAAIALLLPVLNEQFAEFRGELPGYVVRLENAWQAWLKGQTRALPRDLRAGIQGLVDQASTGITHYVQQDFLPRVAGWVMHLPWLVLVPIFAFFLLKDADQFRQAALAMFPGRRLRWRGDVFFEDVNRTLAAYIRSQLLASLVMAVVCTAGFVLIGVPYGVVLGIAAGLLEFVPLAGPLFIAVCAVAVTAMVSSSQALTVAGFLIAVRIVQDYVINPKLVGREIPLHPMAVILAILCGGEIAGLAGIFLAVPVLAVLTVAHRHWRAHRTAEPPPRPAVV
jgi:predicted PurR-regulated permease PerM